MYVLILLYVGATFAEVIIFSLNSSNTASGGYTVSGNGPSAIKMAVYIGDMIIGIVIMIGTCISLGRIIVSHRAAGVGNSLDLYRNIVTSDALLFVFVFAIELYKAITSTDPTGATGGLPVGNTGFQHLLDVLKNVFMIINFLIPSVVIKLETSIKK
ncbi:hypothetical protein HK405_010571, partial [Cladochytrium tenue]